MHQLLTKVFDVLAVKFLHAVLDFTWREEVLSDYSTENVDIAQIRFSYRLLEHVNNVPER